MSPPLQRRSPSSLRGCKRIQLISHKTAEDSRNVWQDVCLFCSCFPFTNVYEEQGAAVLREVAIRTTDGARNGRWQITAGGEKKTLRCFVSVSVFSIYSKRRCPNTCLADSGVRTRANEPVSARASPVGRRTARKDNPLSVPFLPCIPVVKWRKYGSAEINMTEMTAILWISNTAYSIVRYWCNICSEIESVIC